MCTVCPARHLDASPFVTVLAHQDEFIEAVVLALHRVDDEGDADVTVTTFTPEALIHLVLPPSQGQQVRPHAPGDGSKH